ncbi:cytochrome c oxidase subunit 8B, mitochondrial-like [Vidua macroura]|uniref:cytochrome c oxidase subunit 8B, mitochondrial-like n=1 Tax=Vidua chalybeata TaxID=81927 RepID=UPI0023A90BE9|nr:cytochrome c oxidase subunit 8B, mitochondrial-like [Vidua chalybeata]XP_053836623.1 cytochrome c oxidase subunit 8B, mitochondrial-like [Vidua macroura]
MIPKPLALSQLQSEEQRDRPESAMRGFQRGSQLLAAALRISRVPQAQIRSHPAEHPLSAGEQAIALTLMFSSFLLPTAWVLSNIYNYRSRPE